MSIRPAATVLVATTGPYASGLTALLSPLKAKNQDFRLLMVKRSSKNRFMPSAHVFPGGVAETADTGPHWKALLKEETTIKREREEDERDLMFRVAAVREVFEESNILLASSLNNLSVEDKESWRQKVLKDPAQFYEMCKTCNIKPDINLIRPYSHWITPEVEKYRYDTRFYVATLPTHYTPSSLHQGQANIGEVDAMTWLSPSEAVQAFEEGKIHLPPPTWITLRHLSKFTHLDDLLSFCSPRIFSSPSSPPSLSSPNTILPYLPMVVDLQNPEARETQEREKKEPEEGEKKEKREGGQLIMALPGDEKYPIENLSGERGRIHRMKIKNANHYEYLDSANGVHDVRAKL